VTFTVLLDANVLVPVSLADTLLRAAEQGLYTPLWSERVLVEVRRAILKVHPHIAAGRLDARIHAMNRAFEDALVVGWESLEAGITLPDRDDRHVVAAAIRGKADIIVTCNLKDFPPKALELLGIEALSPDDFLQDLLDLAPEAMTAVIWSQAAATAHPPLTVSGVLTSLRQAGAPIFADLMEALVG